MNTNGDLSKAIEQAKAATTGAPKPVHQVVITLFDNGTCNLTYSCDPFTARAMLDTGRFILDYQQRQALQTAEAQASRVKLYPPGSLGT